MGSLQIAEEIAIYKTAAEKLEYRSVWHAQQKEALSQQLEWQRNSRYRNCHRESRLKEELIDIVYKEEISWKQNSRIHWLKNRDCDAKFFHKVANSRKARSFISSLYVDGSMVEDIDQIERNDCTFQNPLL